jgi:hypothetical protein
VLFGGGGANYLLGDPEVCVVSCWILFGFCGWLKGLAATVKCAERERSMHEMSDDAVDVGICVSFENDVVAAGVR